MYHVPYFKEKDQGAIFSLMKNYPFATLIGCSANGKPVATQIPVFVDEMDKKLMLSGHLMKGSDHHHALETNPEALFLFTGPHTYVSASWYTEPAQASTWNYLTVQARGQIKFLGEEALIRVLERTTTYFENNPDSPASFRFLPEPYIKGMIMRIVAFEMEIKELDHVFKLSQNRDEVSKRNVIEQLKKSEEEGARLIASEMERRLKEF